ncbi:MAG: hypothetical protein AAF514_07660, partial [Verrucomicrobiota bacterium]
FYSLVTTLAAFNRSGKKSLMKKQAIILIGILMFTAQALVSREKPWTPDIPYNTDRRDSANDPAESPWDFSSSAATAEYRMLHLMEAHKNATMLNLRLDRDGKLDHETAVRLRQVEGSLDEALECSYRDAIPYFAKAANPSLLMMMLYHYELYGVRSSKEGWIPTISSLRRIDPETSARAKKLAEANRSRLYRHAETEQDAGDQEPASRESNAK